MSFNRFFKYVFSFFYDKYDGQTVNHEEADAKMTPEQVYEKALPIAKNLNWLIDRNGTATTLQKTPELTRLWRTQELVWQIYIEYTQIAGAKLGDFRREKLGCVLIDDATGSFIKAEEIKRFHQDSADGYMSEIEAINFARRYAENQGWEWHDPATAQIYSGKWEIKTDLIFDDAWIFLEFNEATRRILQKSYLPRKEKDTKMTREAAWKIAKNFARHKEWVFFEPVCADFENGIWNIHLPPVYDYSASIKINDSTGKVIEIDFWSGLSGKRLHEIYE